MFVALKSASIRRIDRSFVIKAHPNIFLSITERPRAHLSRTIPLCKIRVVFREWKYEICLDEIPVM